MATIPELAADLRDGLTAAFTADKTIDADRAVNILMGLAKQEADLNSQDIDGYTIPEEIRGLAADYILRIANAAWDVWDQHASS